MKRNMDKAKEKLKHKIALYIRVSTEEQAANPEGSIKSQEQRLRQSVDFRNHESNFGEITHVFIDKARSGKDTNRPELQQMLRAIANKEVTLVMVTELSRLSRSIKDFCDIWEMMRKNSCQFLSQREQFDTTSAAGEMVLYTIANIAQFERRQTSERLKANLLARAERGLYNGGSVPMGYELDPEKKGYLNINSEQAEVIREVFETFVREKTLTQTGKSLNERGFGLPKGRQGGGNKTRPGHFTIGNLYSILKNKAYIGVREFKKDNVNKETKACWDPIIDQNLFYEVQNLLSKNTRRVKTHSGNRYPYLLSTLTTCGKCGDRLPGKSAHGNGGKIAYYEHSWSTKKQACLNKKIFTCHPKRFLAKKIEPLVWNQVMRLLSEKDTAKALIEDTNNLYKKDSNQRDLKKLESKIKAVTDQLEALAEHLTKVPKDMSPLPIFDQMKKT